MCWPEASRGLLQPPKAGRRTMGPFRLMAPNPLGVNEMASGPGDWHASGRSQRALSLLNEVPARAPYEAQAFRGRRHAPVRPPSGRRRGIHQRCHRGFSKGDQGLHPLQASRRIVPAGGIRLRRRGKLGGRDKGQDVRQPQVHRCRPGHRRATGEPELPSGEGPGEDQTTHHGVLGNDRGPDALRRGSPLHQLQAGPR